MSLSMISGDDNDVAHTTDININITQEPTDISFIMNESYEHTHIVAPILDADNQEMSRITTC